jgi:hypothetical protein
MGCLVGDDYARWLEADACNALHRGDGTVCLACISFHGEAQQ